MTTKKKIKKTDAAWKFIERTMIAVEGLKAREVFANGRAVDEPKERAALAVDILSAIETIMIEKHGREVWERMGHRAVLRVRGDEAIRISNMRSRCWDGEDEPTFPSAQRVRLYRGEAYVDLQGRDCGGYEQMVDEEKREAARQKRAEKKRQKMAEQWRTLGAEQGSAPTAADPLLN